MEGLCMGSRMEKSGDVRELCCNVDGIFGFVWFIVASKWLIKAWGHMVILFSTIWEFTVFHQVWTLRAFIYFSNTFDLKKTEIPVKITIPFYKVGHPKYWNCLKMRDSNCENLGFGDFDISKLKL